KPLITPPTNVVVPEGSGGGSRMGSWPSPAMPLEGEELSRISVLGSCASLGADCASAGGASGLAAGGCGVRTEGGCVTGICWPLAGEPGGCTLPVPVCGVDWPVNSPAVRKNVPNTIARVPVMPRKNPTPVAWMQEAAAQLAKQLTACS